VPPPLRDVAAAVEARGSRQDRDGGRGRGVVVAPAAALLLAGVDGDALADVARVGRPVSARISCALNFCRTIGVPKNEMTVMRRP